MTSNSNEQQFAGLVYPSNFLSSLPILLPRPAPFAPIRALSVAQFAEIQKLHALADEDRQGDSVLFPFLHGIEGNNVSQNSFFANPKSQSVAPVYNVHPLLPPVNPACKVPKYRGLVWVRADEHDGIRLSPGSNGYHSNNDEFYMDEDDDDEEEEDDDELSNSSNAHSHHDHSMQVDAAAGHAIAIPSGGNNASRALRSLSISTTTTNSSSEPAISPSTAPTSLPPSPSSVQCPSTPFSSVYSHLLTSTLRAQDLLVTCPDGPCFAPPRVPDGISLRNFGIQVPIYATLSDIVIYAPKGMTRSAFAVAERFKHAIEAKARERERYGKADIVHYNVFVITEPFSEFEANYPHLVAWDSNGHPANYIDFALREREEMCNLTQATEVCDGVWLGNSSDVPKYQTGLLGNDPFTSASQNNPAGFDICIECCDGAQFPSSTELACAQGHIQKLDELWATRWQRETNGTIASEELPPRPPPSANHILHLAFPSSPMANQFTVDQVLSFISFLQTLIYPEPNSLPPSPPAHSTSGSFSGSSSFGSSYFSMGRRDGSTGSNGSSRGPRIRRKCRVLLYSTDGYTETSILALCFLMAPKPAHYIPTQPSALSRFGASRTTPQPEASNGNSGPVTRTRSASIVNPYTSNGSQTAGMSLPDAYLELQIARGRSFYVYPGDLDLLKRAEARLYKAPRDVPKERGRDREVMARTMSIDGSSSGIITDPSNPSGNSNGGGFSKWKWSTWGSRASFSIPSPPPEEEEAAQSTSSASAMMIPMLSSSTPNASLLFAQSSGAANGKMGAPRRRARASTSPMPHVWADHWAWFSDPRFDGSFPSRVLPFLYLGNLAHASNAYMLHALGITHVVSVGECALVPPQSNCTQAAEYRFSYGGKVLGAGPGSLWIEEREGRIKVLDIKGVSDDGIDSLRPRFREVCDWIDAAREQGGKVLVHCRVGVSRSATVTIAYVMKYLNMPLVDAYLLVRSRRLSVLIQPNLRLLFNLCSWEVEIARERAETDPAALNSFLSRRLSWPYLSREVHTLNEKYIQ